MPFGGDPERWTNPPSKSRILEIYQDTTGGAVTIKFEDGEVFRVPMAWLRQKLEALIKKPRKSR